MDDYFRCEKKDLKLISPFRNIIWYKIAKTYDPIINLYFNPTIREGGF